MYIGLVTSVTVYCKSAFFSPFPQSGDKICFCELLRILIRNNRFLICTKFQEGNSSAISNFILFYFNDHVKFSVSNEVNAQEVLDFFACGNGIASVNGFFRFKTVLLYLTSKSVVIGAT